jgi:hypothetical protein
VLQADDYPTIGLPKYAPKSIEQLKLPTEKESPVRSISKLGQSRIKIKNILDFCFFTKISVDSI